MLFPADLVEGIRSGAITVAFRNWKRPTVRAGGTLQTRAGLLGIDAVDVIDASEITAADARASGAASVDEVLVGLRAGDGRQLYRVRFHRIGDDPRVALRSTTDLGDADRAAIDEQLDRWDRSRDGPWTQRVLEVIDAHPGRVSTELAAELEMERMRFKNRVRQLKSLGLTISLDVGYELSARGRSYLAGVERR